MQCPLCPDSRLEPKYVGTTEVDICPKCRGIWLDRGELDRLVGDAPAGDDRRPAPDDRYDERRSDRARYDERDRSPKGKKTKARRLADLFEDVLDF